MTLTPETVRSLDVHPFPVDPFTKAVPAAGIVFDIDGTLAEASSAHLDCLAQAAADVLGVTAVFTMVGEKPYLNGSLVAGYVDAQCFAALAREVGRDWDRVAAEVLDRYVSLYRAALAAGASPGRLIPGVPALLDRLAAAGIPMGLATGNASGIAQAKLEALGIADYFVFTAVAGFGDRHGDRVQVGAAAVAALVEHRGTYLVGDTVSDIASARTNGVRGIGVCTGAATGQELLDAGAYAVLADVTDLDGMLGLREGRWFPRPVPGVLGAADMFL